MKIWLNVEEGAEYAGVCKDLIYDACTEGKIRHVRVDGRRAIRMKRESIDAWFERHAVGPQEPAPVVAAPGAGPRRGVRQ